MKNVDFRQILDSNVSVLCSIIAITGDGFVTVETDWLEVA